MNVRHPIFHTHFSLNCNQVFYVFSLTLILNSTIKLSKVNKYLLAASQFQTNSFMMRKLNCIVSYLQ